MKRITLLVVSAWMSALITSVSQAATITASSVNFSDVAAALTQTVPGDTVQLPAGTATWTSPLNVKGVSLIGSGTNSTIIIDNLDRNADTFSALISIHGAQTGTNVLQVANFQIRGGNQTRNWHGEIITDFSGPIRFHHLFFNECFDKNLMLYGANQALVDHCIFKMVYSGILIRDTGWGDASWASPPNYGTALMPVVEDCYFTNTIPGSSSDMVVDCEFGGRCTFRRNLVLNSYFETHGTESGGRNRGGRVFEVYSNTFVYNPAYPFPYCVNLRAGSGVFYGNVCSGTTYFGGMNVNRATECFNPWGRGDGTSPWDDNVGVNYLSGTHSGPNGVNYLKVTGANWTVNQWVGYTVVNQDWRNDLNIGYIVPNGNTNFNYSVIISNSVDQIFYHISKDYGFMLFTNGNRFVINKVNRILDQPGLGSGDLVTGEEQPWGPGPKNTALNAAVWPREVLEGVYSWNNTLNGVNAGFGSDFPTCKLGRDFFNDTPKPGYTPLVYPHPLQSGNSGGTGGGATGALEPPDRVWITQ